MNENDNTRKTTRDIEEPDIHQQLEDLAAVSSGFLKRELVFWAIRWVIGFSIIAAIVHYYPDWSWLWWAGGIVCAITLTTLLLANVFLKRKLTQAQENIDELEKAIQNSKSDEQ